MALLAGGPHRLVQRTKLAMGVCLLLALAWMALSGGVAQLPRALTLGQRIETAVQLGCGVLALVALVTTFRWRGGSRAVRSAWTASLMISVGLSSVVWGAPSVTVGVVFAIVALLVALGIFHLVGASTAD